MAGFNYSAFLMPIPMPPAMLATPALFDVQDPLDFYLDECLLDVPPPALFGPAPPAHDLYSSGFLLHGDSGDDDDVSTDAHDDDALLLDVLLPPPAAAPPAATNLLLRKPKPAPKKPLGHLKPTTTTSAAALVRPRLRNFSCVHPGCGKSFADNAHLKDHMFVHTGEKSLRCPDCDKCFARVASLRSHRRVHTGERPFLCPEPECGKRYASRAALRMHVSLHAPATSTATSSAGAKLRKKKAKKASPTLGPLPAPVPTVALPELVEAPADAACAGDDCAGKDCHRGRVRRMAEKIKEQRQVILDLQAQLQGSPPRTKKPSSAKKASPAAVASPAKGKRVKKADKTLCVPMVAPLYLLQDGIKPFKCMVGCGRTFSNYFQLAFHAKQHPEKDAAEVLGDQLPFPVGPKYCPVKGCEFSEESGKSMKTLQIVKRHWQRVHQNTRPFLCPDCPPHAQKAFKTRDNLTAHRKECKKRASLDDNVGEAETPVKRQAAKRSAATAAMISPPPKKRTKPQLLELIKPGGDAAPSNASLDDIVPFVHDS